MIDLLTLKQLRSQEASHKNRLIELPTDFIEEVNKLTDLAIKNEDYSEYTSILHYFRLINELRQFKIIKFVIYRSKSNRVNETDIEHIRDDEHDLFVNLLKVIVNHDEYINSKFNGKYIVKTDKIGGLNGETQEFQS